MSITLALAVVEAPPRALAAAVHICRCGGHLDADGRHTGTGPCCPPTGGGCPDADEHVRCSRPDPEPCAHGVRGYCRNLAAADAPPCGAGNDRCCGLCGCQDR